MGTYVKSDYKLSKYPSKNLPYSTKSICPICLIDERRVNVLPATIAEENSEIYMVKACPAHGEFKEKIWSDSKLWDKANHLWYRSIGLHNPQVTVKDGCPLDCGLCSRHLSHTALGLIDVTLRCNLKCPICFANAGAGAVSDPSPEEVVKMLKLLRGNKPVPSPGVQFAGGEPTLSEQLPSYIRQAKSMGFNHIMVATNGVRLAEDPEFLKRMVESGLNTVYLQFDGVTAEPYLAARGVDLREVKDKAIDNCRKAKVDGVILVPTIVGGLNLNQLGGIIDYALKNRDIIRCINFQPVSITGRIDRGKREEIRVTIPDLINGIDDQTGGLVKPGDWYPISSMLPVGRALGLMHGRPFLELSAHPGCGMATFLVFDPEGKPHPISELVNLECFIGALERVCDLYSGGVPFADARAKLTIIQQIRSIKKPWLARGMMSNLLKSGDYDSLVGFMGGVIMLGMMHFMDPYNLDLERAQHCDIHYSTREGRLVPFCTYNNLHREYVTQKPG